MRFDTKHFCEINMIKQNFNVLIGGADPFLAQMSVNGRIVTGGDIRSLK
jgi:hypothetical protein